MELICIVENTALAGSSYWGEHGLSFLVKTEDGNVLWDTGQSGDVWRHNWEALDLAGSKIDALALSHSHKDHTGGLEAVLLAYPDLVVHAHSAISRPRYSRRDGQAREAGISSDWRALQARADWRLSDEPCELIPGVRTTGTIVPRHHPQGASPNLFVESQGKLVPDPYADDMSLVLDLGSSIVLLCGCCHAGLRNTLETVRRQDDRPLTAIVGGAHLAHAHEDEIDALEDALTAEGEPRLYLNHCTGENAIRRLWGAFGAKVIPCPAGTRLAF